MNTVYRAAELHLSDGVPPGALDLGYLTGLPGFDAEISLLRAYTGARSYLEDDFSTYPGGPGFAILHRAVTDDGITMRQAAAWWDIYRHHPQVLLYRAVFAVETNHGLTAAQLGRLLHSSGITPARARRTAIDAALHRRLIHVRGDGRLAITSAGQRHLHPGEPDLIGQDNTAVFPAVPR